MTEQTCFKCGEPCITTGDGIAHHWTDDGLDHDADADHVAIPELEDSE